MGDRACDEGHGEGEGDGCAFEGDDGTDDDGDEEDDDDEADELPSVASGVVTMALAGDPFAWCIK